MTCEVVYGVTADERFLLGRLLMGVGLLDDFHVCGVFGGDLWGGL